MLPPGSAKFWAPSLGNGFWKWLFPCNRGSVPRLAAPAPRCRAVYVCFACSASLACSSSMGLKSWGWLTSLVQRVSASAGKERFCFCIAELSLGKLEHSRTAISPCQNGNGLYPPPRGGFLPSSSSPPSARVIFSTATLEISLPEGHQSAESCAKDTSL